MWMPQIVANTATAQHYQKKVQISHPDALITPIVPTKPIYLMPQKSKTHWFS
jgi:hypothetical protein